MGLVRGREEKEMEPLEMAMEEEKAMKVKEMGVAWVMGMGVRQMPELDQKQQCSWPQKSPRQWQWWCQEGMWSNPGWGLPHLSRFLGHTADRMPLHNLASSSRNQHQMSPLGWWWFFQLGSWSSQGGYHQGRKSQ